MRITVAICTWNRCHLLRQALDQMMKLVTPPRVDWELLVVNNNSTDATDEVIASFSGLLPIRRLFERRPGKSHALNLAVRHASGKYILWTDDDVLVDEKWIVEYCEAFSRWPDAAIFGGPVQPWFAGAPPAWLQRVWPRVANAYAMRDFGREPVRFTQDMVPFGLNMAVRTKDQARYLYDLSLGPQPNNSLRGEETTLVRRMLAEGAHGWGIPGASVRHYIPRERQTIRYLRGYFFGYGQYLARMADDTRVPKLFGKPRWAWKQVIEAELGYHFGRLASRPEVWIEDLKRASICWGRIYGFPSQPPA